MGTAWVGMAGLARGAATRVQRLSVGTRRQLEMQALAMAMVG